MTKRRIILVSALCALAAIYILQLVLSMRSPQKTFRIKETPNYISIENSGETIIAQKSGDNWYANGALLDSTKIEYLIEKFSVVKTLSVASHSDDQNSLERYGLDSPIVVRAKSEGNNLRAIFIGKESVSGSQVYVQIEGKKEIYLAQGNMRRDFTFKFDDLIQKEDKEETEKQIMEVTE